MGRPPRLIEPGGVYHVQPRGSNRGQMFWDDADVRGFLSILSSTVEKLDWRVFAFCVMPNHYHLLVKVPNADLSQGMQRINGGYSRRTNARYDRVRHLFQNRFSAVHVRTHSHLLETIRYIPLNPVRAGLCADPADWRWSSFQATAGLAPPPSFLDVDFVRRLFGTRPKEAALSYAAFVRARLVSVSDTETSP